MVLIGTMCCRILIRTKCLVPYTCISDLNRSLATEGKKMKWKRPVIKITPRKPVSLSKSPSDVRVPVRKSFNAENDAEIPPYVEVDPHHSKLVRMLTAVKTKRQRYSNMMIMLEGKRLIQEALAADITPILILFSRKSLLKGLAFEPAHIDPESTIIHHLPYRHMKTWSSVTTSPGIIGIFRMPNLEKNAPAVEPLPITLICDNIRDPGNLGSVLRVAAALPVEKVILTTGCTDLWDPKVTRGSCGAMFHLQVFNNASWDDVRNECSGNVILADHKTPLENLKQIDDASYVQAESYYEDPEAIFDDNENEGKDENDKNEDDLDDNDDKIENLREIYKLPTKSYCDIQFGRNDSYVVVVGGETEGLSESSFQFASEMKGIRANIPLAATVSSLNAATALGIISFEIKRQLSS